MSITRLLFLSAIAVAFALTFACSDSSGDPAATPTPADPAAAARSYAERGAYGVGVTTMEFVDTSRPTAPNRDYAGAPDRTIPVEIWYPAAADVETPEARDVPSDSSGGPYPLIVFAHGYGSFRRQSASYAQELASRGYVVAAPSFPGTDANSPGGARLTFTADQPADVSFVLDELLARDDEPGWMLAGTIDSEHIGLTGHSGGGLTTMLTLYGERRDPRIDAAVAISPFACVLPEDLALSDEARPLMVIGGTLDGLVGMKSIRVAYDVAPAPKYFVGIIGADHTRFADVDIEDTQIPNVVDQIAGGDLIPDIIALTSNLGGNVATCADRDNPKTDEVVSGERQRELLRSSATPFFDAYLREDAAALGFVKEGLAQIEGLRFASSVGP